MNSLERRTNLKKWIFFLLFILLNTLNCFLCTTSFFNAELSPYPLTGMMMFNFLLGSIGMDLLWIASSILIFKLDRHRFQYLIVISSINTLLCFALCIFVYNFGMMFSFTNLKALNNPAGAMAYEFFFDALLSLLANGQYMTFIPLGVFVLYYFIFLNKKHDEVFDTNMFGGLKLKRIFGCTILVISSLSIISSQFLYSARIHNTWFEKNESPLYGIQNCGMWNYYVRDAIQCYFVSDSLSSKEKEETKEELSFYTKKERTSEIDHQVYGNSIYEGSFEGKNLLLIQMESMNNFTVGLTVHGKEITPNLNKMIENGLYWNHFYTTVGIGNTSDAEFSAMTGLRPTGSRMTVYEDVFHSYPTLAKDFKDKGYQTFSIHGNTGVFYNRFTVHKEVYGFDQHYDITHFPNYQNYIHTRIADEDLLNETVSLMSDSNNPTFAFAILVSCHIPYEEDSNVRKVLNAQGFSLKEDVKGDLLRGYLEHTYYVDYCLGQLLSSLEEKQLLDQTIIALYGDHGGTISHHNYHTDHSIFSYLPFHDEMNHMNWNDLDTFSFRQVTQEIPFLIYEGSEEKKIAPQQFGQVRSQVDIKRTMDSLFSLSSSYYFGVDALGNEPTFHYAPRTLDVMCDAGMISATSLEYHGLSNEVVDPKKLLQIKNLALKQKQLNDRLLKYDLFS